MLTSLLPGVRELRAPLAAGFILMFALWIGLEPPTSIKDTAPNGIWRDVLALRGTVSVVGLGAAIAFVAYLLGSLSEALITIPVIIVRQIRSIAGPTRVEPPFIVGRNARRDLRQLTDRACQEATSNLADSPVATEGELASVSDELATRVQEEFEAIRTRLLIQQPEVFARIDRMRSEAQLRVAIALPLIALAVALASRDKLWWGVGTVAAAGLLAAQGLVRYRSSNEALVEALSLDTVTAPSFDDLFAYTEDEAGQQRLKWAAGRAARLDDDVKTGTPQAARRRRNLGSRTASEEQPARDDGAATEGDETTEGRETSTTKPGGS